MSTKQKTDIVVRRRQVGAYYLRGKSQPEIAELLEISQPTVSRDLKFLRDEWLVSSLIDIDAAKSRELAKIDALEIEYWESWERSKNKRVERTVKQTGQKGNPNIEQIIKEIETHGDVRFLQGVERCIDKRCQILGLDAPQKFEIDWKTEIVEMLKSGDVMPAQILADFPESQAQELFKSAGIDVKSI